MSKAGRFVAFAAAGWLATGASLSLAEEPAEAEAQTQYDFLQVASSGTFKDGLLTLNGIGKSTVYFAERPARDVGEVPHAAFVQAWTEGTESLAADPPNASLVANDGGKVTIAVVELTEPKTEGDSIHYRAKLLGGALPERIGQASLFIDPGQLRKRKANSGDHVGAAIVGVAVATGLLELPGVLGIGGGAIFGGDGGYDNFNGANIQKIISGGSP
jgi:hypothetical protein